MGVITTPAQRGGLVRACLVPKPGHVFVVADFSGVEARALAWAANDTKAIDMFRTIGEVYKPTAAGLYGVKVEDVTTDQRKLAKEATLGLGYGMGHVAFERHTKKNGVDWSKIPLTPAQVVKSWRKLRAPVVRFWRDLEKAWGDAVVYPHAPCTAGPFTFRGTGTDVHAILPSGRRIVYRDAAHDSYQGPYYREHVYGGKLAENVIQAVCRDFLGWSLVLAADIGLTPVLTVHDEIICEEPEDDGGLALEALLEVMSEARMPEWGRGMPLAAEGYVGRRYRK